MGFIINFWKKISYLGISKNASFANAKPIILTNRISLLVCLVCFLLFFNYWLHDVRSVAYLQFFSIFFFAFTLVLNYLKRFKASRVLFLASANISVFITSSMLGYESGEHLAYFPLMIAPFILFNKKEISLTWLFAIISGLGITFLEITNYELLSLGNLPLPLTKSLSMGNSIATVALVAIGIGYFRNISEEHIDTIIHDAYEDLKAIFNNSYDAIFILNPDTNDILDCNERALTIFGFKNRAEAFGKPFFSLQKNPVDTRIQDTHDSRVADRQYLTCEGTAFWGNLAITHVVTDDKALRIARVTDITESKKAEEKLKESEINYRKLASNIPDTDIFLFDNEWRIILAEGTIMQKQGLGPDFFEGKFIHNIIDATYKPHITPLYEAVLKGEQVTRDIAMGEEFLNMRGVPLRDTQGNISGGLMVSQDITLRKQNEQELVQAKEKAEDASIAKAQFLSTMSHELRTPLNAVIGISHLLLQEAPQPEQLENLHLLRFSAENLLALINDILDFSKIEVGKVVLETVGFNIRQLLDSTTQLQKIRANEKNLSLTLDIAPDVPDWVLGDPTRLSQILNNLLSNAIKFTSEGGVSLQVALRQKNQQIATLSFSVKDSGIGIPPDKIDTIFDQFSQADSHTTRQFGGTGLGLAITKKLLLLHNSNIQVSSQVGQGTLFSFDLTFGMEDEPKKEDKKSPSDAAKVALNGVKVLLVEDNAANLLIAGKFLKNWQVNFDQAGNGQQAIEKVSAHAYDLILMDLQMPVMDGYQAAIEIRKFNKQIPIIALTASAMLEVKAKIREAMMDDIVVKPFDPEDLYQKINTWATPRTTAIQ